MKLNQSEQSKIHVSMDFNTALKCSCSKLNSIKTLKKEQKSAIKSLCSDRNVFSVLPTGFGKSLIFSLQPSVMDKVRNLRKILNLYLHVNSKYIAIDLLTFNMFADCT